MTMTTFFFQSLFLEFGKCYKSSLARNFSTAEEYSYITKYDS